MTDQRVRVLGLGMVVMLVLSIAAIGGGSAAAAAANQPDVEDVSGAGWELEELRQDGTHVEDAPASARMLGSTGSVAIRHEPQGPMTQEWKYLEPGTTVRDNELDIYSVRFGEDVEPVNATLTIVYWQEGTATETDEDGTTRTVPVARNVTKQETNVTLGPGYDQSSVRLHPHYEEAFEMTIWLSIEGERVKGAQWRATHHSITSAQPVEGIDSQADLWVWASKTILLIAIPGLLLSRKGVNAALSRAGAGPMKGLGWWGVAAIVATFFIALLGYYQTAVVLSRAPQIMGALIVGVGLIAMLEDDRADDVLFEMPVLTDAVSPQGDAVKDTIYEHVEERVAVDRDDGTVGLPKEGIRPFLARLWADPATLDVEDLKTEIEVKGDWTKKFIADPGAGWKVLDWEPAHWEFDPPLMNEDVELDANAGAIERLLHRVNWRFLMLTTIGFVGGYQVMHLLFGLASLSILAGLVPVLLLSYRARDGHAEFQPAPIHMTAARATVRKMQSEYDDAQTIEDLEEIAWSERTTTALEARAVQSRLDTTVTEKLNRNTVGLENDDEGVESADDAVEGVADD